MVGGAIADPAPTSERSVKLSLHSTPEHPSCWHTAPAVGAGVSTTTTEPFQSSGLANAIVMLEVPKEILLSLRTSRVSTSSRHLHLNASAGVAFLPLHSDV